MDRLARGIAGNAPLSVKGMKSILAQALREPAERDMAGVLAAVSACFDSADHADGRTASMENRQPVCQRR